MLYNCENCFINVSNNGTLLIAYLGAVLKYLAIALLLFGGKKIPELMKGLGSGIKEFKNAAKEDEKPADKKEEEKKE